MSKSFKTLLFILIVFTFSSVTFSQDTTKMVKMKRLVTIGELICTKYRQNMIMGDQSYRDCVKKANEPFTLPDLRVHGISVSAGRYDNSGFVTWDFVIQVKNTGGTKALQPGFMPVYTQISFGRVCPEHEYCPDNWESLMEEHWIQIPRPDTLINLAFKHEFYDPDGSGTIPKSIYVLIDSRIGGHDCVPGVVIESNEYNNVGYLAFNYTERGRNYWYVVY